MTDNGWAIVGAGGYVLAAFILGVIVGLAIA